MPEASATAAVIAIFNEFKDKITNLHYLPQTPIETLKSRMTAVSFLESNDPDLRDKAANFIQRTATTKKEDLQRLKSFAATIKEWRALEICSIYTNSDGAFVEYKMSVLTTKGEELVHRHALYKEQWGRCCYVSQNKPLVRVIGDPVLHQPGKLFPIKPTEPEIAELHRQIAIAKDILVKTSGGGIAANQCALIKAPYKFAIVGVFQNNPTHVQGVARRYPGVLFPAAMIMVNPQIVSHSATMQNFKHACLSVPSPNRCEVQSPKEITVDYLDPDKNMAPVRMTLKGMDAVVLWHEMNHILDGKTYIDTAIASLKPDALAAFKQLVVGELNRRKTTIVIPELTVPPFYYTITINNAGKAQLDADKLIEVLPKFTTETLNGFLQRCHAQEY